jgi:hypothetical protein
VFVEIELGAAALIRDGRVIERAGAWSRLEDGVASRTAFRRTRATDALGAVPGHVRRALGDEGSGALALEGGDGPAVVPARWRADDDALVAVAGLEAVGLARAPASCPSALAIDGPSSWRARRMLGCMVQGTAELFAASEVRSGGRALAVAIGRSGGDAETSVLARVRARRLVWWQGWTSGSANVA